MADPVKPKRDILEKVLGNPDLVRRIERLFEVAGEILPAEIVAVADSAEGARAGVANALALISALNQLVELSSLAPPISPQVALDDLRPPRLHEDFIKVREGKIGNYGAGNYLNFERTGFQEAHGDARGWDDVYPSAVSIGKGANAPAITSYLTGTNFDFLAPVFASSAPVKELTLHNQIYHSYDQETDIENHIHLYVPDDGVGGDIVFNFEYYWANIGDTGAPSTTTGSATLTRGAGAGIAQNIVLKLVDPAVGTGKLISSIFSITISRDTGDSFGSSVWLLSADCHIRKNTPGSRQELVK